MTIFARYSEEFPEQEETRCLLFIDRSSGRELDKIYLEEHYCADPDCDCQRVMFYVYSRDGELLAVICYDFLDRMEKTPDGTNPFLEPGAEQPAGAQMCLAWVTRELERDAAYRERLRRHYREMKQLMRNPAHPLWPAVLKDRRTMSNLAQNLVRSLTGSSPANTQRDRRKNQRNLRKRSRKA
jgi:hypothetical protein